VSPLFFPGGDIGRLAVFGTVNDLVVSGSEPLWLSLSLIIEEGMPISTIDRILDSIRAAADASHVQIVTGDTKVVPRGAADQLFITTAGIGRRLSNGPQGVASLQEGDAIIVSGPIGRHGAAILCAREKLDFDPVPASDCAPLRSALLSLLEAGLVPKAVRDATRGGVAAVLHEWAEASQLGCTIFDDKIPTTPQVRAICELLGLDALHLANEGTFVLSTSRELVARTLEHLQQFEVSASAVEIGFIRRQESTRVSIVRLSGREVPVEDPSGAPLPRIC
jgi:hydrogenase expression/formation protein HypE